MNNSLKNKISRFLKETDGPTTVEYAIMLAFVVLACMSTIYMLGEKTGNVFKNTADQIEKESAKSS